MSMTPESPLFPVYEAQLDEQIAEQEFHTRMLSALDTIQKSESLRGDARLMLDSGLVAHSISTSGLDDARSISRSVHTSNEQGNRDQLPARAYMSTAYDPFERSGVQCSSHVAKIEPSGGYGFDYGVFRLVMAVKGQRTLPDGRGYYIARSNTDDTLALIKVSGVISGTRLPARVGQTYRLHATSVTDPSERKSILEELEKAASALPPNTHTRRS